MGVHSLTASVSMRQNLVPAVAAGLVLGTGLVAGLWTGRWKAPESFGRAAEQLTRLPRDIGNWRGEDLALDERQVTRARLAGYVMRRYRNRIDGGVVTAVLMCGRPGPLAAHTPDICFGGAGYELSGPVTSFAVPNGSRAGPAEFALADFRDSASAEPSRLCILWSWTADGRWAAPSHPRLFYASARVLYKLYLAYPMPLKGPFEDDPRASFIPLLLSEIDRTVLERG